MGEKLEKQFVVSRRPVKQTSAQYIPWKWFDSQRAAEDFAYSGRRSKASAYRVYPVTRGPRA